VTAEKPSLLLVASRIPAAGTPPAARWLALAARWRLVVLASASSRADWLPSDARVTSAPDEKSFLREAKDLLTNTALDGVLFLGTAAAEERFAPLRHLAGPDQSLVLVLPDADDLRALPGTAAGLKRRDAWDHLLRRADAVWTTDVRDAVWLRLAWPKAAEADVLPRDPDADLADWVAVRLARARDAVRRKDAYGAPKDLASLVILTHNDGAQLRRCLASVGRHTGGPHEVIVVDNATADGSTRFLDRERGLRLIRNRENRFFAGGCNQGLARARGEYAVLLNADTVVTPGWLESLVRRVKRDPTAGLAGPYTNRAAGPQRVEKPGYRSLKGLDAFARRWAREHEGGRLDVPRLDGFCLLVKREVLDSVGLLDERFGPGGYEDYDYCLRARQAGWRLILVEEAYVHHEGGRGYGGMDYDALRKKNRELLVDKWCRRSMEFLDEVW
jgi:hypothetical protein